MQFDESMSVHETYGGKLVTFLFKSLQGFGYILGLRVHKLLVHTL